MLHRTKPRGGARREDKRLRTVCQSGESQQRWLNQESPAFRRGECQLTEALQEFGSNYDGFQILGLAQQQQIKEVGSALVSALMEYEASQSDEEEN